MFAVIKTGGKQYRVAQGDVIYVEKLDAAENDAVSFDVLLVEKDGDLKVGAPLVEGAKVEGKVLQQGRGENAADDRLHALSSRTKPFLSYGIAVAPRQGAAPPGARCRLRVLFAATPRRIRT